ncbi:MAG: short-chain dehydrogenase, partial [Azorhizobium sp. 32-67-21]
MAKIVIYGGSGGIGAATARLLHRKGFDLHLVGRDAERLASVAAGIGADFTVGDVTDDTLFARVAEAAGERLAGLAYAVGTINLKPLARLSAQDFAR